MPSIVVTDFNAFKFHIYIRVLASYISFIFYSFTSLFGIRNETRPRINIFIAFQRRIEHAFGKTTG